MTETTAAPWHVKTLGMLTLLWNLGGAVPLLGWLFAREDYMQTLPEANRAFFEHFAVWATVAWLIAVSGAVIGSVLILMRRRSAEPVLVVAFAGLVVMTFHNFVLNDGASLMRGQPGQVVMTILVPLIMLGTILYARNMTARGVLR